MFIQFIVQYQYHWQYEFYLNNFWFIITLAVVVNMGLLVEQNQSNQSFLDLIKHNKLASALIFGTFSAAAAFFIYKYHNSIKYPTTKNGLSPLETLQFNNQDNDKLTIKEELDNLKKRRQLLAKVSKDFTVQYSTQETVTGLLSEECVLNIFDLTTQLVDENELNELYETNRKARRTVFEHILINAQILQSQRRESFDSVDHGYSVPSSITSPKNIDSIKCRLHKRAAISYPEAMSFSQIYYRFVCTFEQNFKYLIEKTQKDIAVFLNIDFQLITESINFHISKEDNSYFKQKIQEWTSLIKQSLKNKLKKYSSPIEPVQICKILNYQINYLTQKKLKLLETIKKLGISNQQEIDALPTLLESILEDELFLKFNVQQEQITVDLMHMSKNKELEMLVEKFQLLTENIVEQMYEEVQKNQIHQDPQQI